jgi:hypothetical protein
MRFCRIQTKRASKVRLKPVVPAQNTTMPPRLTTKQETGNVCFAGMLEHEIDVVALAGDVPDRLAELARLAMNQVSADSGESPSTLGIGPSS